MNLRVHYQGLEVSPWLEDFIESRLLSKLERYLSPSASIQVDLRFENNHYSTGLAIHNHQDYSYAGAGENLYESFSAAIEKAVRDQGVENRRLKEKIHRKFFTVKWVT